MFSECRGLKEIPWATSLNTSRVKSMNNMFSYCSSIESITKLSFDTGNCTDMSSMFFYCESLTDISGLSTLKTSEVTTMNKMFQNCIKIAKLGDLKFDTNKCEDMAYMFCSIQGLTSIDLSSFYNEKCKSVSGLFYNCHNLKTVTFAGTKGKSFVTSACTDMNRMFGLCYQLTTLNNINCFDTTCVQNMSEMFRECKALTNLDLSGFDNVKCQNFLSFLDMGNSDSSGSKLTNVNLSDKFITSECTNCKSFFQGCNSLIIDDELRSDLTKFDISKCSTLENFFNQCSKVNNIDLSTWDTGKCENFRNFMRRCYLLDTFTFPVDEVSKIGFVRSAAKDMWCMFGASPKIKEIDCKYWDTSNVTTMAYFCNVCTGLEKLNIESFSIQNLTQIGGLVDNCSSLKEIKLGANFAFTCKKSTDKCTLCTPSLPANTYTGKWTMDINEIDTSKSFSGTEVSNMYPGDSGKYVGTWYAQRKAATVHFDGNGGSINPTTDYNFAPVGGKVMLPSHDFTFPGKYFRYWTTKQDGTGDAYEDGGSFDTAGYSGGQVITLYAQWEDSGGTTPSENGVIDGLKLRKNEMITFEQLPGGANYLIEQKTPDGWIIVDSGQANNGSLQLNSDGEADRDDPPSGTIEPNIVKEVKFVNTVTDTPVTTKSANVALDANVLFNGSVPAQGQFNFKLLKVDGESEVDVQSVGNKADGSFSFSSLKFDAEGTYNYKIYQIKPEDEEGITFDTVPINVEIVVTKNEGEQKYEAAVKYLKDGKEDIKTFINTGTIYRQGSLQILDKTETAELGDKEQKFGYLISLYNPHTGATETKDVEIMRGGSCDVLDSLDESTQYTITPKTLPGGWSLASGVAEVQKGTITKDNPNPKPEYSFTYKASGDESLKAYVVLNGKVVSAGDFAFKLKNESGVVCDSRSNGSADANGRAEVSFNKQSFTLAKGQSNVYKFTIVQDTPETSETVEYDKHVCNVNVTLTDREDGTLSANIVYSTDPESQKANLFTNKVVRAGVLSVNTLSAAATTKAKEAKNQLKFSLKDFDGLSLAGEYEYFDNAECTGTPLGKIKDGNTITTELGTENSGYSIYLKDLPAGCNYSITQILPAGFSNVSSENVQGITQKDKGTAASFTNLYAAVISSQFTGSIKTGKSQEVLSEPSSGEAKFTLTDVDGNKLYTVSNDSEGAFKFPSITYSQLYDGQTIEYKITQEPSTLVNMGVFDDEAYTVKVNIKDNDGVGTLVAIVKYFNEDGVEVTGADFINLYASKYTVNHVLEGGLPAVKSTFSIEEKYAMAGTSVTPAILSIAGYEGPIDTITTTVTSDDKACVEYVYKKNETASYRVNHYKVMDDGSSTLFDYDVVGGQPVGATVTDHSLKTDVVGYSARGGQTDTVKVILDDSAQLSYYYDSNNYQVQYDANKPINASHEVEGETDSTSHEYDVASNLSNNGYSLVGWKFTNWNSKPDGTGITYSDSQLVENLTSENDATITLFAQWTPINYTIRFNANGEETSGKMIDQQFVYDTSKALTSNVFTKVGHSFVGWAIEPDGQKVYDDCQLLSNLTTKEYDLINLYVVWNINQYTITFDTQGGSTIPAITQDYGTAITKPADPTKEGHTFAGWDKEIPDTMPAENVTITAMWTVNHYTITLDANGGKFVDGQSVMTITQDYGTAITKPTDPIKEGHTFTGWDQQIPTTMPAQDMTITAQWKINQYTITFDTQGGSTIPAITQDYGTAITKPDNPTKTGHTFAGWDKEIPDTMPAENVTITAKWTVNQYTITLDANGGKFVDGQSVMTIKQDYGTAITKPANPTKEGHTFTGWDNDIPVTMPAEDMTITAQWKINQYTITFDTQGGSTIPAITQDYGTEITKPADPTKEGHTFSGWDKEIPATMPAENITITAMWTVNHYTITLDANGGKFVDGQSVMTITQDYGTAITKPTDPIKEGHTFTGWDQQIPTTMPAQDMTITAQWKINQYTITFDTQGGSTIPAITQDYGTAITKPDNPTKSGHTFAGWDKEIPATMPAENLTITAMWTVNHYTITLDANGGKFADGQSVMAITQDYGSAITKPANPTKEGHTFTGWDQQIPTTMPAQDMTITAQWKINQYTITFDANGGFFEDWQQVKEITQDFGTPIIAPESPTKDLSVFIGWDPEVPETMPAYDMTVKAAWKVSEVKDETKDKSVNVDKESLNNVLSEQEAKYPGHVLDIVFKVDPEVTDDEKAKIVDFAQSEKFNADGYKFYDATLTMSIDQGPRESIGDDNNELIKVNYDFDFAQKTNLHFIRNHNFKAEGRGEVAEELTESANKYGEYIQYDKQAGKITVYAKKYSTYAVSYCNVVDPVPPTPEPVVDDTSGINSSATTGDSTLGYLFGLLAIFGICAGATVMARRKAHTKDPIRY